MLESSTLHRFDHAILRSDPDQLKHICKQSKYNCSQSRYTKEVEIMNERAVREYLLRNDERFRELFDEHQQFERKLAEFTEKSFLTSAERFEETVLKKKKLALKDRMQCLIQEYRVQHSVQ